jgi:hypothetical protein
MAGASAIFAAAGTIAMAFPIVSALAPHAPLPSPATVAAQDVPLDKRSAPVRIQIPFAGIDLPVVSSDLNVPGNRPGYPLCDVAQWWTRYQRPGAPGTTWILAHAQPGMFLPLFDISERTAGSGLLGKIVEVQTKDKRVLRYRITEVRERAPSTDVSIAGRDRPGEHRLVLQTSTGPAGTDPKLQVAARLIGAREATEPAPRAQPRACWQAPPKPTRRPRGGEATPAPTQSIETSEPIDSIGLLLGSGAILLGVTFIAVFVVRRSP